jgi:hypothetical protein
MERPGGTSTVPTCAGGGEPRAGPHPTDGQKCGHFGERRASDVGQLWRGGAEITHGNFQPKIDPKAVVQYAMEHGINDLTEAKNRMLQDQVAQRATASPQSARAATRGYAQKVQAAGGLHNVVASRHPELSGF